MNKQITLTLLFISLFFIIFNAKSAEMSSDVKACNAAVNKGDTATAITTAETILKADKQHHEGLVCKARALSIKGDVTEALAIFDQALQATNDDFEKIITYILIGNVQKNNGQPEQAITAYQQSLKLCAKSGNQTYTRINHNLIGDTYKKTGDLDAAIDSYKSSVSVANNDNERADSFGRLASAYHTVKNHDKAIEFQLKSTLMQQKAGTLTDYAEALLALGQYQLDATEHASAKRTFKKLHKLGVDNGGAYYEAMANYKLGQTLAADGDNTEAKQLMESALTVANKIGATALATEIKQAKSTIK